MRKELQTGEAVKVSCIVCASVEDEDGEEGRT